jgi:hypothetical protein
MPPGNWGAAATSKDGSHPILKVINNLRHLPHFLGQSVRNVGSDLHADSSFVEQ